MNRNDEYSNLLAELEDTPQALEYTIAYTVARAKKAAHRQRFLTIPLSGIAVLVVTFIFMVNISPSFAIACGRIPLLRELAAAVDFSPSLKKAVENEYVQPIELEQSENGITMRVEYVIVDQKQLNIFYSLQSEIYFQMDATPLISTIDGLPLEGYAISSGGFNAENGELRLFTVDFVDNDMPDGLMLTCMVHDNGSLMREVQVDLSENPVYTEPDFISTFKFPLNFDPEYTQHGEIITLNQSFMIDSQHLIASTIEIYPTHIRLNLVDDENNTAWLQSLDFYLENENGQRFDKISNGITATGSEDSPMMRSHRLDSPYFFEGESFTLYITGAVWLDKNAQAKINLADAAADTLPEGVKLENVIHKGNNWKLRFSGVEYEENHSYQIFTTKYYDEAGNEYEYNSWSTSATGYYDETNEIYVETPGIFYVEFMLLDYPYDVVYLMPSYSRSITLETPVAIIVK